MENIIDRKKVRILWLGTPEISANVLNRMLSSGYNIIGVVSQIDKPIGRKQIIEPVPTKIVANLFNIPVFQPIKIRLDYEFVKEMAPDLIISLAYGQLIPQGLLDIPKYGCLNLHGSLLPKYRGAAPMQYALLNGDDVTGITLMEMIAQMDAGKMFFKKEVTISDEDNIDSLTDKMADAAFYCVEHGLDDYLNGLNKGVEQKEDLATFTTKIKPEDQIISFSDSAKNIHNKIRALSTQPGAFFVFKNANYKVFSSDIVDIKCKPGEIFEYTKNGLVIGTTNKSIRILSIQKPGKKSLSIKDFFNGNRELFKKGEFII